MPDKDKIKKLLEEINKLDSQVLDAYYEANNQFFSYIEDKKPVIRNLLDSVYCLNEKLNKVIKLLKETNNG